MPGHGEVTPGCQKQSRNLTKQRKLSSNVLWQKHDFIQQDTVITATIIHFNERMPMKAKHKKNQEINHYFE